MSETKKKTDYAVWVAIAAIAVIGYFMYALIAEYGMIGSLSLDIFTKGPSYSMFLAIIFGVISGLFIRGTLKNFEVDTKIANIVSILAVLFMAWTVYANAVSVTVLGIIGVILIIVYSVFIKKYIPF